MGVSMAGAVLIGSGPSLNRIDPHRLAGVKSIAFNRAYLAWPSWGFAPTYHACLDPRSLAIIGLELPGVITNYPATRFFLHRDAAKSGIEANARVSHSALEPGTVFSSSLTRLTDFGNVGATSLQVLAMLDYRRVLMVGVDGTYRPEDGHDRDPNHFRDDYAAGRDQLTDADRMRYSSGWPAAAAECGRLGVEVMNASPGTSLTCFAKIDLEQGLDWLAEVAVSSNGQMQRLVI